MHLADACAIFKFDFDIICIFRLGCDPLLTTDSTSVPLPVLLKAVFPYARLQVSPREISKIICKLKAVIHSFDIRLVLLSLKYRVVSFRTQNKTVLLFAAPPVRKTSPFFTARARPDFF